MEIHVEIKEIRNRNKIITEIAEVINRNNLESGCNTPDYLIAEYLVHCLEAYNATVRARDKWYGIHPLPGNIKL